MARSIKPPEVLTMVLDDMCRIGGYAWQRGWAEMNAGNMSVEVTRLFREDYGSKCGRRIAFPGIDPRCKGRLFIVTCAGARFRDMNDDPASTIVLIRILDDLDGYTILWGGGDRSRATSELATHFAIHANMCDKQQNGGAVLHAHPTHLVALTHIASYCNTRDLDRLLRAMHPEVSFALPGGIGFVPYYDPGGKELADATGEAAVQHRVIVWEKHGSIGIGDTIDQAFDLTDVCNKAAEIFFLCKGTGHDVQGLGEQDLRTLKQT